MKNREPITAEQLGRIDQNIQEHNWKQLISGKLTFKERKDKLDKLDKIFKHQLFLIMTNDMKWIEKF